LTQVDEIIAECPTPSNNSIILQRCLFSATIGPFVKELAEGFLKNPIHVAIGVENSGATTIDQKLIFVGREDGKLLAIRQLIQEGLRPPVLLFVQSIDRAKDLYKELVFDGINVDIMHSNRSAVQREEVMKRFRQGEIWVLICTDLMARGIDFQGVQMVINYDLPNTAVSYIHRIGRTGRAGRTGEAVTFFTEHDIPILRPIANVVKLSGCPVPDYQTGMVNASSLLYIFKF
jgi:ATP-dependent RNA helicase DDX52/ROK1